MEKLREIGNIGAGNASKALSELNNEKVEVEFPSVKLEKVVDIPEILGDQSEIYTIVSVKIKLKTDIKPVDAAYLLLIMEYESAKKLSYCIEEQVEQVDNTGKLTEEDKDALKETGNILTGATVSALTEYMDLKLEEEIPSLKTDILGALLDDYLLEIAEEHEEALSFNTKFELNQTSVKADFMILFKPQGRKLFLDQLDQ